jgi:hypothetical protein
MAEMKASVLVLLVLAATISVARADEALHVGVDVRTDLGTHHARLPFGYSIGEWDTSLVVDPMVVFDGQHDFDLLVEHFFGPRLGLLAGYRWSAIAVDGGLHNQQRTLLGATAIGPSFLDDTMRTRFSLELATLWVKHGGGAETDWMSADRNLLDHLSFGFFMRIEYARGL